MRRERAIISGEKAEITSGEGMNNHVLPGIYIPIDSPPKRLIGNYDIVSFDGYNGEAEIYDVGLNGDVFLARYEEHGKRMSAVCLCRLIVYCGERRLEKKMIDFWIKEFGG